MAIPEVFSRSSEIVGTVGFRTDIKAFFDRDDDTDDDRLG